MDRRAQLRAALIGLHPATPIQVWPAIVKSIQGNNCTVDLMGSDLEDIPDVNLRADDGASEGVLMVPRVGSFVYVAAVENAVDNLFVCLVSEVDRVEMIIGSNTLKLDSDTATIKQGTAEVTLSSGKVAIKNNGVSLKNLFTDLTTLLQNFKVVCATAGAPSASVFPDTLTSIANLSTKVNQLLS